MAGACLNMGPGRDLRTSRRLQIIAWWSHGYSGTQGATCLQASRSHDPQIRRMQQGLVVLIAENDEDMRGYVRRCVEKHDVEIETILEVRDGQEALDLAREHRIDLLITDGAMPRLDGFALCAALRAQATADRTSVLVITGQYDAHEAARRASAAGADGLLLKPFNTLTLCAKIDEVLRSRAPPSQEGVTEAGEGS